jgi:hypothetical protein
VSAAALSGCVEGIGLLGPGMCGWSAAAQILGGRTPWVSAPTVLPRPEALPPAERRRTGAIVKLTLAAGLEACRHAGVAAADLAAVFSSSGGDGLNCHEICEALASSERQLSPTRFHNSVHNAASGYWGIATGATPAANALCAYDGSFAAGLLEALTQVVIERTPVLLVAYDAGYPEPIRAARPIPDAFAVALVLAPQPRPACLARIEAHLSDAPANTLDEPALESLRTAIPAARSLPLLQLVARGAGGQAVLDYLPHLRLAVRVSACR